MNRVSRVFLIGLLLLAGAALACSSSGHRQTPPTPSPSAAPTAISYYGYEVVNFYPHDLSAFTEGLVYEDGVLYESTGLNGHSSLHKVDLETGKILQEVDLGAQYFAEGITIYNQKIIQMTWQSHLVFVYDMKSLALLREVDYPIKGWGITYDGERLIISDGTSSLYFLDPEAFQEIGSVKVFDDSGPVVNLNELEYVNGEIYANVWLTDRIAIIKPQTGQVVGWIDLTGLLSSEDVGQSANVLNGIAYDAEHYRLFVTGKLWPKLFEIRLVPRAN
jgi:glutamine cyclotransferase